MARIEIMPEEFEKLILKDVRSTITLKFKENGFDYVRRRRKTKIAFAQMKNEGTIKKITGKIIPIINI